MLKETAKENILKQYAVLVSSCWHYAAERRKLMVIFYIMSVFGQFSLMMQPFVIGQMINTLQKGGDNLLSSIFWELLLYAGLMFMFWFFHGPARIMEQKVAFQVRKNIYNKAYHYLVTLPLSWHHDHHSGNIINRVTKATNALYDFASNQFLYIGVILKYCLVMIILTSLSWPIALVMISFSIIIFVFLNTFDKKITKQIYQSNEEEHKFSSRLFDYINNIASVISFSLGKSSQEKLSEDITKIYPHAMRQATLVEVKWCAYMCASAVVSFTVLLLYIRWHIQPGRTLMLGNLVIIFQYLLQLNDVFAKVTELYQRLIKYRMDINSIEPIKDDFEKFGIEEQQGTELVVTKGKVMFEQISFSYLADRPIFKDFDLVINSGEKIGLVGSSGAGKTTLVQILMRFYNPQSGRVLIDGQDIHDVSTESLRRNVAVIPQDISLFETSVAENIRIARPEASEHDIARAAQLADADKFITGLPQGYDTMVGERGIKLSGGQRQRIAIARAFLKAAPILVLDEATSALDSVTENEIQEALDKVMAGRTTLVIAHRLSTLRRMDRVIVLDRGQIIEQGTHDQLLAMNGRYAQMWTMQAGGFLADKPANEVL